jgi:hypothetical protein
MPVKYANINPNNMLEKSADQILKLGLVHNLF